MAALNHTNVAMLNKEMRNNDWRINALERKINALNVKLDELIEDGIGGESGGDNTGGSGNTGGNGIDVVFREFTSGTELINELVSTITNGFITDIITGFQTTFYESLAPSSYIKNLRPSGQWESFFTADSINYHTYSPMISFMDMGNNGVRFNVTAENIGGDIMNILSMIRFDIISDKLDAIRSAIITAGEDYPLSLNGLYYVQRDNSIASDFPGATIDHFTLHFE